MYLYGESKLIYYLRMQITLCPMSNFSEKQEEKKETKEKEKTSRETLGKFFYDLAKISFTALVVGSVVSVATQQEKIEYWVLILIGVFVTYIFSYIGYKIIKA